MAGWKADAPVQCVNYCLSLMDLRHKHFPVAFKNINTQITSSFGTRKVPYSLLPILSGQGEQNA